MNKLEEEKDIFERAYMENNPRTHRDAFKTRVPYDGYYYHWGMNQRFLGWLMARKVKL